MMATQNVLRWNFDVPDINNLLNPIQRGYEAGVQDRQRAVENKRADEQIGMQRRRLGMEQQRFDSQAENERLTRLGKTAAAIHQMPDGPDKAARAKALMDGHADLAHQFTKHGINGADPVSAVGLLAQSWGEYDPLAVRAKQAQIAQTQASTSLANAQAGNVGQTDSIREFQFAKKNGFPGTFDQWRQQSSNDASLNVTWGTNAAGELVPMQTTKSGQMVQSKLPEGVSATKGIQKVDLGTHYALINTMTGQTVGTMPKDIAGKEREEQIGQAQGKAITSMPQMQGAADRALATIDQIRKHPGKPYGVGVAGVVPGIPGSSQRGFIALVDQAKGQAFLNAFESLKGGGAITEVEGAKATAAIARLDRAQSMQDFDAALKDLEDVIKGGVQRARAMTTVGSQQQGNQPAQSGGWSIQRVK